MSTWHDFGTVLPPPNQLVRLRRFPEGTPPYFGTFDADTGTAVSGVGAGYQFVTPWHCLTHWTILYGAPGQWPQPPSPEARWRDPFWTPPTEGQRVWLRRFESDTASVQATWAHAQQAFAIQDTSWLLPWHYVWKWKPR